MPHEYGLEGSKRLFPTYRHHRHSQLRLFENLVVFGILGERSKLSEAGPHSAWLRVSGGKEISGDLVRLTSIAGKVIPNSVKVDTLPAGHQPFRIRSMEVEVPNPGIQENLVPGIDPRDWRVHNNQPLNLVGVRRGVGVRDHVTDVVSSNKRLVVSQRGHNGAHVLGLSLFIVAIGRLGGAPNTTEIRHHYCMVLHEICGQRSPGIAIFCVPMNEHHYGPASARTHKNVCPFRALYGSLMKARGQGRGSLA